MNEVLTVSCIHYVSMSDIYYVLRNVNWFYTLLLACCRYRRCHTL